MDLLSIAREVDGTLYKPSFTNIDLNLDEIVTMLESVNKYTYDDLLCKVYNSYKHILDDVFIRDKEMRKSIIKAFNNIDFVKAFAEVISNVCLTNDPKKRLTTTEFYSCNKLIWDYLYSPNSNDEIEKIFHQLNYNINKPLINMLSTKIDINIARYIALARYSSTRGQVCATRVNSVITGCDTPLSAQNIADIYDILYKNDSILPLFEGTMYDANTNVNNMINYNIITFVVFNIIENNMTSNDIYNLLYKFAQNYNLMGKNCKLRCDITKYVEDNNFIRIKEQIIRIFNDYNIVMP